MTRDVVTVTEDTDLADVATLLETKRIKRVPVMREGKIVGIISRANLVRALGATMGALRARAPSGDDRAIRARLLAELGATGMGSQALGAGHHRQRRRRSSLVLLGRA